MTLDRQQVTNNAREYLSSPTVLVGLLIVGFALYSGGTAIPAKYTAYTQAIAQNVTLATTKNTATQERSKMQAISQALDKYTMQMVEVPEGGSPQLSVLGVAQRVAALSEETQNTYGGLEPVKDWIIDTEKAVTIPVTGSPAAGAAADPAASSTQASEPLPAPAPAGDASAGGETPGGLKVFEYNLKVTGTFTNLATFLNKVTRFEHPVIIKTVMLTSKLDSGDGATQANLDEVVMTLTFLIPWK